jgi:hypothetical protein
VAGTPEISGVVLDESSDGRVQRGIWQHTEGVSRDVDADELFVVLSGRATIDVGDGATLEVGPGDVGILRAGDRTTWTVHETLPKISTSRPDRPTARRRTRRSPPRHASRRPFNMSNMVSAAQAPEAAAPFIVAARGPAVCSPARTTDPQGRVHAASSSAVEPIPGAL